MRQRAPAVKEGMCVADTLRDRNTFWGVRRMTDHDPGSIRPLLPDGTVDTASAQLIDAEKPRSNRALVIGGIVLGVIVVGAIGAVIAWRTLVGSAFASAAAVPPDADFVMTFDLLQVRDSDRVDRLIEAFTVPAAEQGLIDDGDIDVIGAIDEDLAEEIGMTLGADVVPWIGRSVSLAMWVDGGLTMDELAEVERPEDFIGGVLVVGVRDGGGAEEFIADLSSVMADETDGLIERRPHEGGMLTTVVMDDLDEGMHMWLGGDFMIMAIREADLNRSLTARDGESIRDRSAYEEVMASLPSDRLMAMYVGTDWIADLYDDPAFAELGPQMETVRDQLDAFEGIGMAMTLRDEGVSFDMAFRTGDPDLLPVDSFDASGLELLGRLPDDTLFHVGFPVEEAAFSEVAEPLRDIDAGLYDEIAGQAHDLLGVDLFEDVLPAFGREAVLAVVPTPEGLLADEFGISVGGVAAIGVTDRGPVSQALASLEDFAIDNGVNVVSFGDVSVLGADGQNLFAYALGSDVLALGTGPTIVDAVINGVSPTVAENPRYRELDGVLPGDGVPLFVDFQGIFDVAELEQDQRAIVNALQAAGLAGEVDGDLVRVSFLVTIDY